MPPNNTLQNLHGVLAIMAWTAGFVARSSACQLLCKQQVCVMSGICHLTAFKACRRPVTAGVTQLLLRQQSRCLVVLQSLSASDKLRWHFTKMRGSWPTKMDAQQRAEKQSSIQMACDWSCRGRGDVLPFRGRAVQPRQLRAGEPLCVKGGCALESKTKPSQSKCHCERFHIERAQSYSVTLKARKRQRWNPTET